MAVEIIANITINGHEVGAHKIMPELEPSAADLGLVDYPYWI